MTNSSITHPPAVQLSNVLDHVAAVSFPRRAQLPPTRRPYKLTFATPLPRSEAVAATSNVRDVSYVGRAIIADVGEEVSTLVDASGPAGAASRFDARSVAML